MVEAAVYIGFAMLEVFSILVFILASARLKVNEYKKEIMVGVTLVSISTYMFNEIKVLSNISPMLCLLLFLSILVFLFRISLIHSIVVVVIGYIVCLLIQGVIIYAPTALTNITFNDIKKNDLIRYSFQTFSALIIYLLSRLMSQKNIGFIFIPYSPSLKFKITKKNMNVIYLLIITSLVSSTILEINKMAIGILMLIILFNFAIFMGIRRERGVVRFD